MEYSILQYLWFFIIYSFLGWSAEVAFHTVTSGKFVNRGFLNGPVCPIYGFGMVILIFSLQPLIDNFILLFIASFFLTSILEFITGFALEKIFHIKWWDYSDKPFNIKGYVSLSFSILWGLAAVFMLNIVQPIISDLISSVDNKIGNILLLFIITYFIIDFIVTVKGIMKINKHMRLLDEIAERLKVYSDDIGENIHESMTKAVKTKEKISSNLEDLKISSQQRNIESDKLKSKYDDLVNEKHFVHKRLEKSFPNIKKRISQKKYRKKS